MSSQTPKRKAPSSTSSSKFKRSKADTVDTGQAVLDRFFLASPKKGLQQRNNESHHSKIENTFSPKISGEESVRGIEEVVGEMKPISKLESKMTFEIIDVDEEPQASTSTFITSPNSLGSDIPGRIQGKAIKTANVIQPIAGHVSPVYESISVDPVDFTLKNDPWPRNTPAPYSFLTHTLSTLSKTRSRISIMNALTNSLNVISQFHAPSLLPAIYLLSNTLSAPYLSIELGLGPSVISKAIQHVSGLTPAAMKRLYNSTGDVGDVAYEAKSNLRTLIPHPPLLVKDVYESLIKIASLKGPGSGRQKQAIVEKLMLSSKGEETRYLTRTLSQNLRVGASRTSITTALARAMVICPLPRHSNDASGFNSLHASFVAHAEEANPTFLGEIALTDQSKEEIQVKFVQAESLVKKVFVQHPNFDDIVAALLEAGLDGLAERVPLVVGIPLHPTLGSPTRSLDEIYAQLGDLPFTAEFKYDGQRAQIHGSKAEDGTLTVHIFSRHLEDMTSKYPDVISLVESLLDKSSGASSFIMDSEIVAIDPTDGSLKSFQELSNRARKDVLIEDVRISVAVFAFDLMYLDAEILLERPFRQRRSLLRDRFPPFTPQGKGVARLLHVESCESADGQELFQEFWERAIDSRCEGLMIKLLDSGEVVDDSTKKNSRLKPLPATYEPDKRTSAWLKLKKDYVTGLGDSLDLVPIGAWHGNGRKSRWWSPILLALWDSQADQLVAVCKCMSGFTDAFYKVALSERYPENSATCSAQPLWGCETGGLKPGVYFKPQEVWEIRGADVTLSPVSMAAHGLISQSRGLSLRFPRFLKVREDKGIDQASTPEFLAKMWTEQQGKPKEAADDGDLLDADIEEEEESDTDI